VKNGFDMAEIVGQEAAKRALLIAAAGGHNIAFIGPPGTGKTLLARAFSGILPPLSPIHALEVAGIQSIAGALEKEGIISPPFRAPHHTSSYASLIGGGTTPRPGEVTLAHRGVLFLDEFPEFDRRVIEALRQPLEDGFVSVSRAKATERFPARFILVAAMNPCPCGNAGSNKECVCAPYAAIQYRRKISGPIADRIDLWVRIPRVEHRDLISGKGTGDRSEDLRARAVSARNIARQRFLKYGKNIAQNGEMNAKDIREIITFSSSALRVLERGAEKLDISSRGIHRVMKISQTIADLEGAEKIADRHVMEALAYRERK
ncbi:YifB family Mg chelatase-like AAA ATPase, partial [bacterium]|nr:YifB family Mg chelatase-like AAA ATPase [bacterium]